MHFCGANNFKNETFFEEFQTLCFWLTIRGTPKKSLIEFGISNFFFDTCPLKVQKLSATKEKKQYLSSENPGKNRIEITLLSMHFVAAEHGICWREDLNFRPSLGLDVVNVVVEFFFSL